MAHNLIDNGNCDGDLFGSLAPRIVAENVQTSEERSVRARSKRHFEGGNWGHLMMCGIAGFEYKMGVTTCLDYHKAAKHGIGEKNVRKLSNDGDGRDKQGKFIKMC